MSNLKQNLIRIGSDHPDLQEHLSSILDHLSKKPESVLDLLDNRRTSHRKTSSGIKVDFKRDVDSPRLAQHIQSLRRDHHEVDIVEVSVGDRTEEGVWVKSVRPGRLDLSMGGLIYQFEGRTPEDAAKKWVRDYNVKSSVSRKSNLKSQLIRIGSQNPDLQKHLKPILSSLKRSSDRLEPGTVENVAFQIAEQYGWAFDHSEQSPNGSALYFEWGMRGKVKIDVVSKGDSVLGTDHIVLTMSLLPKDQRGQERVFKTECENERDCKSALDTGFRDVNQRFDDRSRESSKYEIYA